MSTVGAGATKSQDQDLHRHDAMALAAVNVCNDEFHVMIATYRHIDGEGEDGGGRKQKFGSSC